MSARISCGEGEVVSETAKSVLEVVPEKPSLLKLNLGAGKSKMDGYLSVDQIQFDGLDLVADLRKPWPWGNNTVSDIHMSHALEHFDAMERVHIFNEMYRVLINGGKALIVTPHWASQRAYGDPTHKWPPVSEFAYFYLWREWRKTNAPHIDIEFNPQGFDCDFAWGGGYSHPTEMNLWNDERRQYAIKYYKEVCLDTIMTITAQNKPP
jgi:SAM-dependent methyltransferase